MVSTARVQIDRFHTVDEVEWQTIQADSAPRTVEVIERDLLRAHGAAASCERQIRENWSIRRAIQKRHGMSRLDGYGRSERKVNLIRSAIESLRSYRAKVATLNAEVEAIETRVPAHVRLAAE